MLATSSAKLTRCTQALEVKAHGSLDAGGNAYLWMNSTVPPEDRQKGFGIAEQVLGQLSLLTTASVQLVVQVSKHLITSSEPLALLGNRQSSLHRLDKTGLEAFLAVLEAHTVPSSNSKLSAHR